MCLYVSRRSTYSWTPNSLRKCSLIAKPVVANPSSLDSSQFNSRVNPVLTTFIILGLLVVLGFGVYFGQQTDPYTQAVLNALGNSAQGHEIFEINCAGCHGSDATGNVGPSLENLSRRKSDAMIINQVISGDTPPMPKFQPTAQEMADLLNYLQQL